MRDGLRLGVCLHPACKLAPIWRWSGNCPSCGVWTEQACDKHLDRVAGSLRMHEGTREVRLVPALATPRTSR